MATESPTDAEEAMLGAGAQERGEAAWQSSLRENINISLFNPGNLTFQPLFLELNYQVEHSLGTKVDTYPHSLLPIFFSPA